MKRILLTSLTAVILAGAIFGVWRFQNERANASKLEAETLTGLTAEEIVSVLKSEATADRLSIEAMKNDSAKRKAFLKRMREYLAIAAEARRAGFAEDENFKINLEYKKNILLADLYQVKLSEGKGKLYVVPKEEIEAIWADSENEKLFQKDMRVLKEIRIADAESKGRTAPVSELSGDALEKARGKWARTKILSNRAKTDAEFINQPAISLRLKILEAGILANDYMRVNLAKDIKASDKEIREYVASHPEYDVKKKLEKAEMVLAKAKAGEDFAKLAKEYSEDRASKKRGGLYQDVASGILWKEVEETALKLKPGEIADTLIESHLGFHIVKLVKKNLPENGDKNSLKYSVRHIVLQKKFEEPGERIEGVPPPFMTAEEIAKAEIEKEKRDKFVAALVEKNPISLPEDFAVELPEIEGIQPQKAETETAK